MLGVLVLVSGVLVSALLSWCRCRVLVLVAELVALLVPVWWFCFVCIVRLLWDGDVKTHAIESLSTRF